MKTVKKCLIIVAVLAFVYLFIDFNTRMTTLRMLEEQEQTLQADVVNLESTLAEVNERIDYARSDTAVEEWARQQGLMKQPDDFVIIPLPGEVQTPTPTAYVEAEATEVPNWAIWESLIKD